MAFRGDSVDFLKLKNRCKEYRNSLKTELLKLQGRGFANFIIKETDELIKLFTSAVLKEIFNDFLPDTDQIPFCVIATEKYGQSLVSSNSLFEILIAYKNIDGFNIRQILRFLIQTLEDSGLNLSIKTVRLDEIFKNYKNDFKAKSAIGRIRYISGSKNMYKLARSEIYKAREFDKKENLKHYIKALGSFNDIKNLKQEPDLKSAFGGTNDIYYLNCALNGFDNEISFRTQALKFIDEKELSVLNLAVDFILCVKSAQNLSTDSDVFSFAYIDEITNLMQTKSKKTQETGSIISQKLLSCMHTTALYSRYLVSLFYRSNFRSKTSFKELRLARLKNGFYRIEDTIYVAIHKKPQRLNTVLKELLALGDVNYKFDIGAIFYIKRAIIDKNEIENSLNIFKKILLRKNSYSILKALLDAEILLTLVKPMEHTNHLAEFDGYHKFTVDEHCVLSVKYLENIKDKFIKSLYDELCIEGKIMLKAVTLMHDVGKGLAGEHNITGANIFRAYANRLEFNPNAVNTGVTLIKYHTLMSDVANREDIYSQRVIFAFISKLGDKKILSLLYILSYCVINATDEKLYTPYLAKLLRKLYDISLASFDDESLLDEATRRVKKEYSIRRNEAFDRLDDQVRDKIFEISSNLLFAKHSVIDIINLTKKAFGLNQTDIELLNHRNLSLKIISNRPLNLSAMLAILADFDLAYMEIYELFDKKFFIRLEFNKRAKTSEQDTLKDEILTALNSDKNLILPPPNIRADEITLDINHSDEYAKININARDQRGLMAYVMSVFDRMNIKITSAKIQTIKNRTRNLFLIEKNNRLCYNDEILKSLISE